MSEAGNLFTMLRQSADPGAVSAIEELVRDAPDHALSRVNAVDFATKACLDQERAIAAFLHAALGIFELSWNVLCPGCGGVLDTSATLKSVNREEYDCAMCATEYRPTLDEMVEVTFTVSRRVRRIAAHNPHELPLAEYFRQVFWGSGFDVPEDFEQVFEEVTLDAIELPPGEKALMSLQLPAEFVIVMDPVTHGTQFLDVKGEPTRERQNLSLVFDKVRAPTGTTTRRPGPLRLSLEIRTDTRLLPGLWIAGDKLHELLGQMCSLRPDRKAAADEPGLSGSLRHRYDRRRSEAQNHQPDIPLHGPERLYRTLRAGRRLGSLRLGTRAFPGLNQIVAAEAGAVVKTIGDAVMATFPTPPGGRRSLRMREAMMPSTTTEPREPAAPDRHPRRAALGGRAQ